MLHVLADAHKLARETELLLDGLEGRNGARERICSEQVPGVEAGEVLDCAQELVAADGRGDVFEVVG